MLACSAQEHYLTNRANAAVIRQRDALALIRAGADPLRGRDALRSLSRFHWFAGDGRAAEASGAEAVALLEGLDPSPELARAYSNLAQLRMLAHDTEDAIVWGERALELAERFDDTETAVHALTNVGSAERFLGHEGSGPRQDLEESLRRARAAGLDDHVGRAYASLASASVIQRVFDEGEEFLDEGIAYCEEHDIADYGLYLLSWRARLAVDQGRWSAEAGMVLGGGRPRCIGASADRCRVAGGLPGDPHGRWRARPPAAGRGAGPGAAHRRLQRLAPVAAARAEAAWLRRDVAAIDAETTDAAGWRRRVSSHGSWASSRRGGRGRGCPSRPVTSPRRSPPSSPVTRRAPRGCGMSSAAPTKRRWPGFRPETSRGCARRWGSCNAWVRCRRRGWWHGACVSSGCATSRAVHIQLPRAIRGR